MQAAGRHKEQNRKAERTVALLFSLGDLAEAAAGRIWFVRAFVIWVLRYAEAVIAPFVVDLISQSGLTDLPEEFDLCARQDGDDGVVEALRLAMSFRLLAMTLAHLVAEGVVIWSDDDPRALWFESMAQALMRCQKPACGLQFGLLRNDRRPEVRHGLAPRPS